MATSLDRSAESARIEVYRVPCSSLENTRGADLFCTSIDKHKQ